MKILKQNVKTAKGRKNSSIKWLRRNLNDPYIAQAKKCGYKSRAAMKLLEIEEKYHFIQNAKSTIIDLGCAPGGWLQVIQQKNKLISKIIGIDLKEINMNEISESHNMYFIHGDFTELDTISKIHEINQKSNIELILSDMAPQTLGDKKTDHIRIVQLLEITINFVEQYLYKNGNFVCKIFAGNEQNQLIKKLKLFFKKVEIFKPNASYSDSSEIFIIALNRMT